MTRIIAIGGSQGAVPALRSLLSGLPGDFPTPILVVQHIGASFSLLPTILNDAVEGTPAAFGEHGEAVVAGRIYVAPPDHHMLLAGDRLELTKGPRENWARPALDPLFRSVALTCGPDAIGIVLSGRLNDGTAGLYEIKRQGGIAIVQTPAEAEAADMPQSALNNVPVDFCLPISEMPRLLARLASETPQRRPAAAGPHAMEKEQQIIQPSAQSCPECGGAMRQDELGSLTRFRCHIGHVMTAEVLAAAQLEALENGLSAVLRGLNERAALCRDIAEKHLAGGNSRAAQNWMQAAEEAAGRERAIKNFVEADWVHVDAANEAAE